MHPSHPSSKTDRPRSRRTLALALVATATFAGAGAGTAVATSGGAPSTAAPTVEGAAVPAGEVSEPAPLLPGTGGDDAGSTAVVPLAIGAVTLGWYGVYGAHRRARGTVVADR